jgi:hypothetical protein
MEVLRGLCFVGEFPRQCGAGRTSIVEEDLSDGSESSHARPIALTGTPKGCILLANVSVDLTNGPLLCVRRIGKCGETLSGVFSAATPSRDTAE